MNRVLMSGLDPNPNQTWPIKISKSKVFNVTKSSHNDSKPIYISNIIYQILNFKIKKKLLIFKDLVGEITDYRLTVYTHRD